MKISLVTLGDPTTLTGGYLYHLKMAELAASHDSDVCFVSFPERPFPLAAVAGRKVMEAIRAHAPDAVAIDSIAAAFIAPWLRAFADLPIVGSLHQPPGGIDRRGVTRALQARLDSHAYKKFDRLIAASDPLAAELRGIGPPVVVVAPGRDVAAGRDVVEIDIARGEGIAYLCVGNWIERKGIIELLDAFAALPRSCGVLHLVGDEAVDHGYARRVRERLSRDDLRDRVVLHGHVPKEQVASFYRSADVFVLPSRKEPYGTVYGEAMSYGLPVVGWDAGNLPYLARHGEEGIAIAVGDVAALTAALRALAEDKDLRLRMGEAAARRAETFPTWQQSARMFYSVFEEVVKDRRGT